MYVLTFVEKISDLRQSFPNKTFSILLTVFQQKSYCGV